MIGFSGFLQFGAVAPSLLVASTVLADGLFAKLSCSTGFRIIRVRLGVFLMPKPQLRFWVKLFLPARSSLRRRVKIRSGCHPHVNIVLM